MVKKYTLKTDIDHNYFLVAIKSVLEDYRLAYFLNKTFNIQLQKEDFSLNFDNKDGNFDLFGYENPETNSYWSLILNKQVIEKEIAPNIFSLFEEITNTYILIPEQKKVDFFLKIEHIFNKKEKEIFIKKINQIHRVISSIEIDPNQLKSKDLLIF